MQRLVYLALWNKQPTEPGTEPESSLTFVQGQEQSFLIWNVQSGKKYLTVLPVDITQMWKHIERSLLQEA
jgi:hypothetical protein